MSDWPAWLNGVAAVAAVVLAIPTSRWLDRRRAQRQADAEAEATEASTMEIVDRLARSWIATLQSEVDELRQRLGMEIDNRRALLDHVDVLEEHINEGKPPPAPPRPALHWWHPGAAVAPPPPA